MRMIDTPRVIIGLGLFVASAWAVPTISSWLGVTEMLAFSTVGSVLAFAGGMLLYSGVSQRQQQSQW
ncbi:MAG: hypothetical protein Q4Q58_06770 [Thermoplasmata archaeon]|nr:hypothetical protein [Thermoplasmata archaeon]